MFDQPKRSRTSDVPDSVEPSPVVHLRNLPPHTLEIDLLNLLSPHGTIHEVAILPQRRQALVEFRSQQDAEKLVDMHSKTPLLIGKDEVPISFSCSKHVLQRAADKNTSDNDAYQSTENHVLLFTVYNALHPITIDLLKAITTPYARIVRIVMFGRAQIRQAMVEFRTVEEARTVKRHLNGADIYSGCCTLKVDYARPEKLKVTRNDQDSWDFEMEGVTVPNSQHTSHEVRPAASLLGNYTPYPATDQYYSNGNYMPPIYPTGQQPPVDRCLMLAPQTGSSRTTTPVVMIYKLNMEQINCDRIFNILCPYGNVIRVKFLRSSDGVAMVELGDSHAADRVLENFSGIRMFGSTLAMRASRQTEVVELGQSFSLPDGTPSFKDYTNNKNNRFLTPKLALKNRPFKPSKTLHFWNCPLQYTLEDMNEICTELGAPTAIKLLTYTRTSGRTSSGLVEWENEEQALNALAIVNHYEIRNPNGSFPFILKLSFAVETIRE